MVFPVYLVCLVYPVGLISESRKRTKDARDTG